MNLSVWKSLKYQKFHVTHYNLFDDQVIFLLNREMSIDSFLSFFLFFFFNWRRRNNRRSNKMIAPTRLVGINRGLNFPRNWLIHRVTRFVSISRERNSICQDKRAWTDTHTHTHTHTVVFLRSVFQQTIARRNTLINANDVSIGEDSGLRFDYLNTRHYSLARVIKFKFNTILLKSIFFRRDVGITLLSPRRHIDNNSTHYIVNEQQGLISYRPINIDSS